MRTPRDGSVSRFVGRERELDVIGSILGDTHQGRLRIAVIEGEPGIGKTRLLTEALSSAAAGGVQIHRASCMEHERARAFAPLAYALGCVPGSDDPKRVAVTALLAETVVPRQGDLSASHFRLIEDLLGILESAALEGPAMLVLEDVHWADAATLAALRTASSRLSFVALAIVLTLRPVPQDRLLRGLLADLADAGSVQLVLGPLEGDAVRMMIRDALGADPDERLLRYLGRAAGNPLYVRELVDALVRENAVEVEGDRATLLDETLPPDLRRTILRRLSFLTDEALEPLRIAAVLGSTFAPADIATVMNRPFPALMSALEECIRAELLLEDPAGLRFRHDLVREALYFDLPEAVRAALHRDVAHALAEAGSPIAQVAMHHASGAAPGDRVAIDAIRRAALTAERSSATATQLLGRAAELAAPDPDLRDDILAELAEALVWSGRAEEAERVALELLDRCSKPDTRVRMRSVVVRSLWLTARFVALADSCGQWLGSAEVGAAERGRLLAARALARSVPVGGDTDVALREAEEALSIGERLHDDRVRFHALRALAHVYARMGRSPEQLDVARRALMLAEVDQTGELLREQPHLTLAQAYLEAAFRDTYALGGGKDELLTACEQLLTDALRVREENGSLWDVPAYLTLLSQLRFRQQRLDDALAEAEAAIAAGAETGTRVSLVSAHMVAAGAMVHRGDLDTAERHIEQAETIVAMSGEQSSDPRGRRLQVHAFRREWHQAANVAWSIFRDMGAQDALPSPYGMVWTLVLAGRDEDARAVAEHAERWAGGIGTVEATFQATFARALAEGDVAWLAGMLHDPPQQPGGGDTGIWLMASCILARGGRHTEAARAFNKAIELYDPLEHRHLVEWYGAIARSCGVRVRLPRRRARARSGWEALTEAERRVVELAAQGLTNPQIGDRLYLSRRTVQSHLSHVFQKLGISSRVELAAAVARRDGNPG